MCSSTAQLFHRSRIGLGFSIQERESQGAMDMDHDDHLWEAGLGYH